MAYGKDLSGAARRHFAAANHLHESHKTNHNPGYCAIAGYLFGLAGEMALKELMRASGMLPGTSAPQKDDPFYAHFPTIKTLLRDNAQGRRAGKLLKYANDNRLFENWNTAMRYAPSNEVHERWVSKWIEQAKLLISDMDA
jgi:hypothetical protein